MKGEKKDAIPVMLTPGRWTLQREGEKPSEAMERLMAGDGEPLPVDLSGPPRPRFNGNP